MPTAPANYTLAEVMAELESYGSEQTRKTYARHGGTGPMFGVSFANLYAMQKRIKKDHALAHELWKTGNEDARMLATLIADPADADKTANTWIGDATNYGMSGLIASYVSKATNAREIAEAWKDSKEDLKGHAAWNMLAQLAQSDNDLPESYFEDLIEQIEKEVHSRQNRTRLAMVGTLIACGGRTEALKAKALAAAGRIGHVEVDHGDTYCKTPDPLTMIEKTYAHRHRKKR